MKLATSCLVTLSGLLGLAGIGRYLAFDSEPHKKTAFDLGEAEAFSVGTRTRVDVIPALILRDPEGFHAMSLLCTHLGCTVRDAPEGFLCPCHGSRYDSQGQVTRGPAGRPLPELRVEVSVSGNLIVHTD